MNRIVKESNRAKGTGVGESTGDILSLTGPQFLTSNMEVVTPMCDGFALRTISAHVQRIPPEPGSCQVSRQESRERALGKWCYQHSKVYRATWGLHFQRASWP